MATNEEEFRWTEEKIDELISFQERPSLYNTKLSEYHNRDKKKAVDKIATALAATGEVIYHSHFLCSCH